MPGDIAIHRSGTKHEVRVQMKREVRIDRSRYTGEKLRDIYRTNGSGKGPALLAIRDAKAFMRAQQTLIAAE